jgi:hypothetical protein
MGEPEYQVFPHAQIRESLANTGLVTVHRYPPNILCIG